MSDFDADEDDFWNIINHNLSLFNIHIMSHAELGIAYFCTFLVCNYLNFWVHKEVFYSLGFTSGT